MEEATPPVLSKGICAWQQGWIIALLKFGGKLRD